MATTLATQFTAAQDAGFIQKVTIAVVTAAVNIAAEAPSTANHPLRAQLATEVFNNPQLLGAEFAWAVASQQADTTSTDTVIQTAVNSVWNAIAGLPKG